MRTVGLIGIGLLSMAGALDPARGASATGSEPTLRISWAMGSRSYTRSELLERPDVVRIQITRDPAYDGQPRTYQAVALHSLWEGVPVPSDALLLFKCIDGFSAPIARDRVLNASPSAAIAFLAVEPAGGPWPKNAKGVSPGPFYLVWKDPEKSGIQKEEWPFQLAAFEVKRGLAESYPGILPDSKAAASVQAGFRIFVENCFACHTMNRQGESELGPDLNVPMNVTQYWKPGSIRALVRDPQSVRHWPQGNMPAFSREQLSDEDLNRLLEYLQHMAGRKVKN
jgi:mono/diheme cytochrome c family protein